MKILFFDIETNGFPQKRGADPVNFELFPEILSIAWILWDLEKNHSSERGFVIKREIKNWVAKAQDVHGFDQHKINKEGVMAQFVYSKFITAHNEADLVVCHNVAFDYPIIQADLARNNIAGFEEKPSYCTMKNTTDLCKIKQTHSRYRNSKNFKWPKLQELFEFLFSKKMGDFYDAHNALDDVRCLAECFKELVCIDHVKIKTYK